MAPLANWRHISTTTTLSGANAYAPVMTNRPISSQTSANTDERRDDASRTAADGRRAGAGAAAVLRLAYPYPEPLRGRL